MELVDLEELFHPKNRREEDFEKTDRCDRCMSLRCDDSVATYAQMFVVEAGSVGLDKLSACIPSDAVPS